MIGKTIKFAVGGGGWSSGTIPSGNDVPARVVMTWKSWFGWGVPAVGLSFNSAHPGDTGSECSFAGNAGLNNDGTVTYFNCTFACGPSG